jgi:N-acetylglucosamine-6-phosphate deacetylase
MHAPAAEVGPRVIGAHLEGPFISPRRPGAHDPSFVAEPELALLRSLLASGPVTRVTLAPELPGALELVDELVARGVAIAAGHTEATAARAHAAFDRGVHSVAHLHNAMAPGTHREPSIVAAALAREDVVDELIVDGHHLAADTVLATWRAAPAAVCGRPDLGDLQPGTVADIVVLDDRLAIKRVLVAGDVVVAG